MDEYELFRKSSRFPYGPGFPDGEAAGGIVAGSDFGGYYIEREIYRGDPASVFEAAEGIADRLYALKTFR